MYILREVLSSDPYIAIEVLNYKLFLYLNCASVHFFPDSVLLTSNKAVTSTVSTDYTSMDDESVGLSALVMGY